MCVDVDPLVPGLFQKLFQIVQIMPGNDDKRTFFNGERNLRRNWIAIGFGIRFIQERHALQIDLADLQHDRKKLIHTAVGADCAQRLIEKGVNRVIGVAKHRSVICVGCHSTDTEQDEGFKRTDIFLRIPYPLHIIIAAVAGCSVYVSNELGDRFLVEIHICDRGKK